MKEKKYGPGSLQYEKVITTFFYFEDDNEYRPLKEDFDAKDSDVLFLLSVSLLNLCLCQLKLGEMFSDEDIKYNFELICLVLLITIELSPLPFSNSCEIILLIEIIVVQKTFKRLAMKRLKYKGKDDTELTDQPEETDTEQGQKPTKSPKLYLFDEATYSATKAIAFFERLEEVRKLEKVGAVVPPGHSETSKKTTSPLDGNITVEQIKQKIAKAYYRRALCYFNYEDLAHIDKGISDLQVAKLIHQDHIAKNNPTPAAKSERNEILKLLAAKKTLRKEELKKFNPLSNIKDKKSKNPFSLYKLPTEEEQLAKEKQAKKEQEAAAQAFSQRYMADRMKDAVQRDGIWFDRDGDPII